MARSVNKLLRQQRLIAEQLHREWIKLNEELSRVKVRNEDLRIELENTKKELALLYKFGDVNPRCPVCNFNQVTGKM